MNRNPIVPFIVIMVFGIGLMFLLSFKGLGDSKEIAKEAEGGKEPKTEVAANPEDIYKQTCAGCHGNSYEGSMGPALKGTGLSKDEVADILQNGLPGGMPKGLVQGEQLDAMAEFIANLK
ncbi:cytochrome c550 [Pseudoneobacillus sp. C159]